MIYAAKEKAGEYTRSLNGVYAHGELEAFLEYDVVETGSLETYCIYKHVASNETDYAVHHTQAMNGQGETVNVTCYFWYAKESKIPRGLIVRSSNAKDVKYAIDKWYDTVEIL